MDGVAVEVRGRRGGRGGGVGDRVGGGLRDEDGVERHAEGLRGDHGHLGVQALAHLGAAVGDEDRAVVVDVDERAGLVEPQRGEGDAEFGGDQGEAALAPLVRGVEFGDGLAAGGVVGFFLDLLVHEGHVPVGQGLVEVCQLAGFVHVDLAELFDRHAQTVGHLGHVAFGDEHALGAAKPAEGRVGHGVGLADAAADMDVGDQIAAVGVCHSTLTDCCAEIPTPAAVVEDIEINGLNLAVLVDANLPLPQKGMALAGSDHILLACEHAPHWPACLVGGESKNGAELHRSTLLSSKAATQTLDLDDNLVRLDVGYLRSICLPKGGQQESTHSRDR